MGNSDHGTIHTYTASRVECECIQSKPSCSLFARRRPAPTFAERDVSTCPRLSDFGRL